MREASPRPLVVSSVSADPPPQFLSLAGHPLRWRLLSELARSDRRVGELCELAGRRQSLVSYRLRQLRDGGVVSVRRSAADGRDSYNVLDLARCGELPASAGVALHPGLVPGVPPHMGARAWLLARARAVPVHGQQRALTDGRGALRAVVGLGRSAR
jgi:DNA-binding transcriptional ArsR family regulator